MFKQWEVCDRGFAGQSAPVEQWRRDIRRLMTLHYTGACPPGGFGRSLWMLGSFFFFSPATLSAHVRCSHPENRDRCCPHPVSIALYSESSGPEKKTCRWSQRVPFFFFSSKLSKLSSMRFVSLCTSLKRLPCQICCNLCVMETKTKTYLDLGVAWWHSGYRCHLTVRRSNPWIWIPSLNRWCHPASSGLKPFSTASVSGRE